MKSVDIRQGFIDFFAGKGHAFVPAAPVVPENDPTLLFTNAGMNQFKPYFLGSEEPKIKRAANSQPCIRVSGKHNDLEDVGRDTYHHTSFEMLGNWSFGDYYKKDAIVWAWELLTEVYKLPKAHLLATVYEDDDEAADLWLAHTDINPNHVVRCGKKDNFWEMGATGPCGPCSEIHLDLTPDAGAAIERDPATGGLSSRYMELWNLVFIQYDRQDDASLASLPAKHIDTGAGLERLAAQLQGVGSNYDTDLFQPLIKTIASELSVDYSQGDGGTPHRVISDHIRTVAWAISDNVLPSNDGRGYVLRRLIRRALRFASQAGKNDPFLYRLIPVVHDALGGHYAAIGQRQDYIAELVKAEEQQFLRTVSSGLTLFNTMVTDLKATNQTVVSGDAAFKLYDTYGFPFDLTQVMAEEQAMSVDTAGFDAAMLAAKERSRQARSESLSDGKDTSITALSAFTGDVQHGVYVDAPGGGEARIPVNDDQRFGIAQHHTATHLLHESLRKVLGDSVHQAGSLVDVNRLRFDFSYHQAITADELATIEAHVNDWITENHKVTITEEAIDDAKARGAQAMFGEKYGDVVRVVDISNISIELCGGNHVVSTADLQQFKIVAESAVAAGTRRIEALVGEQRVGQYNDNQQKRAFADYEKRYAKVLQKAKTLGHDVPDQLPTTATLQTIDAAIAALTQLGKQLDGLLKQQQQGQASDLFTTIIEASLPLQNGAGKAIFKRLDEQPIPVLRDLADRLVDKLGDSAVVLVSETNGKGHAIAKVSPTVLSKLTAKDLINDLTSITGGGGGGRDNMAQAGGIGADHIDAGIAHITKKYA